MNTLHVKKGDTVIVISGDADRQLKGTIGEVLEVSVEEKKVIVKGANLVKKHVKPRKQGEAGGIMDVEGAIRADKVALYCPECKKGVRTHIVMDGDKKVRVCSGKRDGNACGHKFD